MRILVLFLLPWDDSSLSSCPFFMDVGYIACWSFLFLFFFASFQVRHLYNTGDLKDIHLEIENFVNSRTPKLTRNGRPCYCSIPFGILGLNQCRACGAMSLVYCLVRLLCCRKSIQQLFCQQSDFSNLSSFNQHANIFLFTQFSCFIMLQYFQNMTSYTSIAFHLPCPYNTVLT